MPTEEQIEAAVKAVYQIEVERVGGPSEFEGETLKYWRRRVVAALEAAEAVDRHGERGETR